MSVPPLTIALLAFCITAEIARELCFKAAADAARDAPHYALDVALRPFTWLGIVFWVSETIALVVVLESIPLSIVYPVTSLPYAGIPIVGALLFRERLTYGQMAGAALIAVGVICVGVSGL